MASKFMLSLLLLIFAAASLPVSPAAVIDVQRMLAGKTQYASFLKLLTQTKVADDVRQLKEASVLVVPDKSIKPLLSLPPEKQRMVMQNHVLLKYLDPIQLGEMKGRTAMLPTLLSGTDKRLGIVNYTKADDGQMYLHAPRAAGAAKLVKVIAARPGIVSIMEISAPIMCPELARGASGASVAGRRGKGGGVKMMSSDSEQSSSSDDDAGSPAPSEAPSASR